ncbi:MAG: hypothetical protein ACI8ZA_002756, partial [Gammaproteobacteria bacterium]
TVNDLHNSPVLSNDKTQNPNKFKVMSFTPLVKGKVGR